MLYEFLGSSQNPIAGTVDFVNVKDSLGEGEAVTITYDPNEMPDGATQIGFFVIPDGASHNGGLTDGSSVTFVHNANGWTPVFEGNELSGVGNNAFFSDQTLNADGVDHMQEVIGSPTQINVEDLAGGGDKDYNDAVINVKVESLPCDDEGHHYLSLIHI